jgi:hypothetical protein
MVWNVIVNDQILLWIELHEDFLAWLHQEAHDSAVTSLDPYRDTELGAANQQRWLAELKRLEAELRTRMEERLVKEKHLPHDPQVRAQVLQALVERGLRHDPHAGKLIELIAACELALENNAAISVRGD